MQIKPPNFSFYSKFSDHKWIWNVAACYSDCPWQWDGGVKMSDRAFWGAGDVLFLDLCDCSKGIFSLWKLKLYIFL